MKNQSILDSVVTHPVLYKWSLRTSRVPWNEWHLPYIGCLDTCIKVRHSQTEKKEVIHLFLPDYVGKAVIRKHLNLKCLCFILLSAVYEICCTWLHFWSFNLLNNAFLALLLYINAESVLQKWTWITFQYFAFIICIRSCPQVLNSSSFMIIKWKIQV